MTQFARVTNSHVVEALTRLRRGDKHGFGPSRDYDVIWEGERYPPKAVLGVATEIATGHSIGPADFSGGEASGQANRILRDLGFEVVPKNWSPAENAAVVQAYFALYVRLLKGEQVVKADAHRELQQQLRYRTQPSVKQKFENISSYLSENGLATMPGYSASRDNRQAELKTHIDEFLKTHPEVLRLIKQQPSPTKTRQYWAFLANPRRYRIEEVLRNFPESDWTINRGNPHAGDLAIIWRAKGNDGQRGIVGLCEIMTEPTPKPEAPHLTQYWIDSTEPAVEPRVWIRHVRCPRLPMWENDDPTGLVSRLSVAKATGGTIFKIDSSDWESLMRLLGGWPEASAEEIARMQPAPARGARRGGQGFGLSPEQRLAVETYAMDAAKQYFSSLGFTVDDVHVGNPYDLLCTRANGELLRVEVKGTTTGADTVILTKNEVELAQSDPDHSSLFIVHSITLRSDNGTTTATGGYRRIRMRWRPDDESLVPLQYAYTVPASPSPDEPLLPR